MEHPKVVRVPVTAHGIIALVQGKKLSFRTDEISVDIIPEDWSVVIRGQELEEIKKIAEYHGAREIIEILEKGDDATIEEKLWFYEQTSRFRNERDNPKT